MIEAEKLTKVFERVKKAPGIAGAIKSLIRPDVESLRAVDDLSLSIKEREMVAILGPNGAGKSTTIKMLTGILTPTTGQVTIAGKSPISDRKQVCAKLGVVFGQRSQLYWELRLGESFEVLRRIYQVNRKVYDYNLSRLDESMGIGEFLDIPVRQLSLGQRMRGEVAAALLHSPPILLLDEPTIGIDIEAKAAIRNLIRRQNEEEGTTVILTSHDVEDVSSLCNRVVIINHGKIVSDEKIDETESIVSKVKNSDFEVHVQKVIPENLLADFSPWEVVRVGEKRYRCSSSEGPPLELMEKLDHYTVEAVVSIESENERELRKASRLQERLLKHYRAQESQ